MPKKYMALQVEGQLNGVDRVPIDSNILMARADRIDELEYMKKNQTRGSWSNLSEEEKEGYRLTNMADDDADLDAELETLRGQQEVAMDSRFEEFDEGKNAYPFFALKEELPEEFFPHDFESDKNREEAMLDEIEAKLIEGGYDSLDELEKRHVAWASINGEKIPHVKRKAYYAQKEEMPEGVGVPEEMPEQMPEETIEMNDLGEIEEPHQKSKYSVWPDDNPLAHDDGEFTLRSTLGTFPTLFNTGGASVVGVFDFGKQDVLKPAGHEMFESPEEKRMEKMQGYEPYEES
ncbi:MAG TPA: hypothetical protein VMW36_10380 [Patescibacteria group bacterium]|nr:hypothetical protein [Patescibacteria group bacterium]